MLDQTRSRLDFFTKTKKNISGQLQGTASPRNETGVIRFQVRSDILFVLYDQSTMYATKPIK